MIEKPASQKCEYPKCVGGWVPVPGHRPYQCPVCRDKPKKRPPNYPKPKGPPAQPVLQQSAAAMGGRIIRTYMNGFAGIVEVPRKRR